MGGSNENWLLALGADAAWSSRKTCRTPSSQRLAAVVTGVVIASVVVAGAVPTPLVLQ